MKIKTNIKAGNGKYNHNEKLATESGCKPAQLDTSTAQKPAGLRVKTSVKAGGFQFQHNEKLAAPSTAQKPAGLRVKTSVKAGATGYGRPNHNEKLA